MTRPALTDAERLDWIERAAKESRSGISFDWVPKIEYERSGFRFMRRFFIGDAVNDIRSAIDLAAAAEPTFRKGGDQ